MNNDLLLNLDKLHTTELGIMRIKRNLSLEEDVISWCKRIIENPISEIVRKGKNWYITFENYVITVNAHSYTIITAHKEKLVKKHFKIKYFVHGTTYDNEKEICSGWNQVELTSLGKNQAKNLGEQNKDQQFDIVFTSDLIRSIDSADIAFPKCKKIQDKRLRECNYGDYDGKSKELVIYEDHIYDAFPNGESLKDVEKRIADFIKEIKVKYPNKKIAIIAHRAPQLAFEVLTKNLTWEEANVNDWRKRKAWQPGWIYEID
jgi:Fructose-2,6-bisphosphatase